MTKYNVKVVDIIDIEEGTKTFYFDKPEGLSWEEGAHIHLAHVGFDKGDMPDKSLVRHMSIMTLPEENTIGITTRYPGSESLFKQRLGELEIGDEMIMFKIGSRMKLIRENRPIILLSMGVGISTMRPMIIKYLENSSDISELVSINVDRDHKHLFREELGSVDKSNYRSYWINSRHDFYEQMDEISSMEKPIYYVVGSDAFLEDVIKRLKENSVKPEDIILDKKEEKRLMFL